MTLALKPRRGGFLRPFGCGQFIHEFLSGHGPYESPVVDPGVGAPQADIFHYYKVAIIKATALDRATRQEEKQARREKRPMDPANIEKLADKFQALMPFKAQGCRFHSFVVYFSTLRRLGWVEFSGREEPSAFQEHYSLGPSRRYYRLTTSGQGAGDAAWFNPYLSLYH